MTYDETQYRRAAVRWLMMLDIDAGRYVHAEITFKLACRGGIFSKAESQTIIEGLSDGTTHFTLQECTWRSPAIPDRPEDPQALIV